MRNVFAEKTTTAMLSCLSYVSSKSKHLDESHTFDLFQLLNYVLHDLWFYLLKAEVVFLSV